MERLGRSDLEHMLDDETAEPKALPLSLLEDITCGFSSDLEIGMGGFAVVYKGIVGNRVVAVKRLTDACMDETKFHREVQCLMQVKHKNIVRFLGYCADRQGNMGRYKGRHVMADIHNRLLCFEYISKGSLDKYITDKDREWAMCYKIIKEICEGMQHLHCNHIVHLDLKPANILLDDNMSPKICDFGLSRCFDENQSEDITKTIIGTRAYLAPELYEGGVITRSADLYSLGVVINEILTGQRCLQETEQVLKSWSDRLERSQRDSLCKQIQVCNEVALQCREYNPKKRPDSAQNIINRLQGTESSIQETGKEKLVDDVKELSIEESTSDFASHNMDGVELMKISDRYRRPSIVDELNEMETLMQFPDKNIGSSVYKETDMQKVVDDVKELSTEVRTGVLASHNMDGVEFMKISGESNITWSDLQKLNSLRNLHFEGCDDTVFVKLDDTVLLHSVEDLYLEKLSISGELFSKVLRCFSALSKLTITECKNLELPPMEDGGLFGLKILQSFKGHHCEKLFSPWPMGEVGGEAHAIKPFPTSVRELDFSFETSMQSIGLLANLTSLTSLELTSCKRLTMDGFNPLIAANLKKLCIDSMYVDQEEGISIAGDMLSGIARSKVMCEGSFQLEELWVDSISAVLTAPISSHLGATLHTLVFSYDQRMTTFTEEQEQAFQLLTSLQYLSFRTCMNLRSLPQGLRGLSSLKTLVVFSCQRILSLPTKEGLPTSLEKLEVQYCSPEVMMQAQKMNGEDPWFSVSTPVLVFAPIAETVGDSGCRTM